MSIYHFMPLQDNEEFQQIRGRINENSSTNCLIIGEDKILKSSLLFQVAVTIASCGDQVLFICPSPLEQCPFPVLKMVEPTHLVLECIKMVYMPDPPDLLRYLCEFHTRESLPAAIIIDDIQHYTLHLPQDQCKESSVVKLFAILQDTIAFISQKRGESCHYMVSVTKGICPKNLAKRYFQELWNLSSGEKRDDYFLTDDHVPGFRVQFHVNTERKIVMDKAYKLALESEDEMH